MNQTVRAPLAGALALVLATTALVPFAELAMAAAVAVIIVLLSIGWARLLELPSPRGSSIIIVLAGLSAVAVTVFTQRHIPFATLIVTVIAIAVFLSFFHEMFRKDRRQLTLSISGTASGALLSTLMLTWLQAHTLAYSAGPHAVVMFAALTCAISFALITLALPVTGRVRIPVAIVAAAATAGAIVFLMGSAMALVIVAAIAGAVIATAAISVFFLVERVIGAYETMQFLALSTSLLPLVGMLEVLCLRLVLTYFPQDMGVAVLPSALGV